MDIYYYESNSTLFYITSKSDELNQISKLKQKDLGKVNMWEINNLMKGYYRTHTSLLRFRNDFNQWRSEFQKETGFKMFYSWETSAYHYFLDVYGKEKIKLLESDSDEILFNEFEKIESCFNSGLTCLNKKFKNKPTNCYAYDYSSYYPTKLSSKQFKFPIKKPKHVKTFEFDNLQYGLYNVSITSNNENFINTFSFSPDNLYTHFSLEYALEMRNENMCEIKILNGGAWIYDNESLLSGDKVFGKWIKEIKRLKKLYPKNKMIKMMSSTLWGVLIQFKRIFMTSEEFYNSDVSYMDDESDTQYKYLSEKTRIENDEVVVSYEVVPSVNPYKRPLFARLKPFLTSFCRVNIARIVKEFNLYDNLVRIQTDSICLDIPCDFGNYKYKPIFEDKSSGLITWFNVNNSSKIQERRQQELDEYNKENQKN